MDYDHRSRETWLQQQNVYWDAVAARYDELYSSPWHRLEEGLVTQDIARMTRPLSSIDTLDLGCGTGLGRRLTGSTGGRSYSYTGVDLSASMLAIARQRYPQEQFFQADALEFAQSRPGSYSLVIALFTAASFFSPDVPQIIGASVRALQPGGYVYLSFLQRYSLSSFREMDWSRVSQYNTRGNKAPDRATVRRATHGELLRAARLAGLDHARITSLGPLVGLFEHPRFFGLNKGLRCIPIRHTLALTGKKK